MNNLVSTMKYDYIFAGAGASATLLLMSMELRGLLSGKRILIIDPDTKFSNDKTYCFWAKQNDLITLQCNHLISQRWKEMCVNRKKAESLQSLEYLQISSITVYDELRRIIERNNIHRIDAKVISLDNTDNALNVSTDIGKWQAEIVFDSRPPKYSPPQKNEVHLLQSFIGFVIQPEKSKQHSVTVDLMDFDIAQQGYTQFMYVLPYNSGEILVELTRFGVEAITEIEARGILDTYIQKRFGKYHTTHIEIGCIPMSTAQIKTEKIKGVITIGGRNGAVKPSTGYAFKNMFNHAELLAEGLQNGEPLLHQASLSRFKFYDRLLLIILGRQPKKGRPIFEKLFNSNSLVSVLNFLDEKTTLKEDIKILMSIPKIPFLKAWGVDFSARNKSLIAPILLLLFASLLLLVFKYKPEVFNSLQIAILGIGLFSLGIPHGALDHLVENIKNKQKITAGFVLQYLCKAIAFLMIWLVTPTAALTTFIIYSIWHFGETDMHEWQFKNQSPYKNWIWGTFLLSIILLGHVNETNDILKNMNIGLLPISHGDGKIISYFVFSLSILWSLIERKAAMLISSMILIIGSDLPLLSSFGLYFIGQHSFNGWLHLKKGLNLKNEQIFYQALPFNIGAFVLFGILLYYFENSILNISFNGAIKTFFVFISCISFPHVLAMNKFYKRNVI